MSPAGEHPVSVRGRYACRRALVGFTLLEMVLSLTLAGVVIVATLSFHRFTLDTRANVLEAAEAIHAQRVVMDRLAFELTTALAYPFLNLGLSGDEQRITFPTTRVPGPAAWVDRGLTDEPVPPEHDLGIVGYRLMIEEEEGGFTRVLGLERLEQTLASARAPEEGEEIQSRLLTPHVRFIAFAYYLDGNWVDSWEGGDLPQAVRITIGGDPLPEDVEIEDYPGQLFQRVVFLPGGSRPAGGGLGAGGGR